MIGRGSARWRGTQLALLMLALAGVVVVGLALRTSGPDGPPDVGATDRRTQPPSASDTASPSPSDSESGTLRPLPSGLDDRGWIAETGQGRWIAGSLRGRILVLPKDEIGLVATAGVVVSVRYVDGGATSTVLVRDLANGRLRLSVNRPGTVGSSAVSNGTVYVAATAGQSGPADAGVQAIALSDGEVRDLISPGNAPADATGLVARSVRLSASGRTLGSGLCTIDRCWIDVIDLATGTRTTPVRGHEGFLAALSDQILYTVNDTSTYLTALDSSTGSVRWTLDDAQIEAMFATMDGSRLIFAYLPGLSRGGPFTYTIGSADASTGAIQRLLERSDASPFSLLPSLSNDNFAVIGPNGSLGETLTGSRAQVALTLVDTRSGAVQTDSVTLTAP
jgi:hypothetical protein